jgi:hypothetical protein
MSVFTQTLTTSQTLTIPVQSDFGDIINTGLLLALAALVVLDFIVFRLVKNDPNG